MCSAIKLKKTGHYEVGLSRLTNGRSTLIRARLILRCSLGILIIINAFKLVFFARVSYQVELLLQIENNQNNDCIQVINLSTDR